MAGRFLGRAVWTAGAAGLGAGPERFIDDGLDGPRTAAAFGAAAEATIELLGVARQAVGRLHRAADIMVAQDVAGTNDHGGDRPISNADLSILKAMVGCKGKTNPF